MRVINGRGLERITITPFPPPPPSLLLGISQMGSTIKIYAKIFLTFSSLDLRLVAALVHVLALAEEEEDDDDDEDVGHDERLCLAQKPLHSSQNARTLDELPKLKYIVPR